MIAYKTKVTIFIAQWFPVLFFGFCYIISLVEIFGHISHKLNKSMLEHGRCTHEEEKIKIKVHISYK